MLRIKEEERKLTTSDQRAADTEEETLILDSGSPNESLEQTRIIQSVVAATSHTASEQRCVSLPRGAIRGY